ncbi:hypothetical protein AJ80_08197 [Polytolypa hystricis UAMH7299]|uniref:Aminotransferase class V domain-containing protein n=1 Tax=Polytolypa hystricis (strain UAMH7299) TaxID=1447883 RepID=A0A2B7XC53_POLH7|nr:hypothetical protein AJ80_08197 [Polytolypa hystricis UAMH7299]
MASSFGAFPKVVRDQRRKFQDETESSPDLFIRYTSVQHLDVARAALAKLLNVPLNETVFVQNATTGVNTALRNLAYAPGDVIVYFATAYAACAKTVASLTETTPLQARKVEYQFPISHGEIVQRFKDVVKQAKDEGLNVRVALLDTIVSQPGVRFPFEELVEVCRAEGVLSCVDGAHGVGHIPLDLGKLDADFFVSNCHKWLYTPRGCAVFHVPKRNQHLIRTTLPTSHGFLLASSDKPSPTNPLAVSEGATKTSFEGLFEFVATVDDSPYLCIPTALEFRDKVCGGEDRIMKYCESLAREAGDLLAEALGTEVMCEPGIDPKDAAASQIRRCAMSNVRTPIAVVDETVAPTVPAGARAVISSQQAAFLCRWLEKEMLYTYNTVVPHFAHGGWIWLRLSGQVYLELEDFKWFAGVEKELIERVIKGEAAMEALKIV